MAFFNFRTKQNQLSTPYFSNNIGFSAPAGENCYEFLVMGKLKGKAEGNFQNKILNLFIENGAQILSFNSRVSGEKKQQFTIAVQCDLSRSGSNPIELSKFVRNLGFVAAVEYQELRGLMYGRSFPLVFYDAHRALALRSNTLIKLGARLARDAGTLGTNALFDEGRSYILEAIEDFKRLLSQSIDLLPLDGYGIAEENGGAPDTSVQAFCVKCKAMREVSNPSQVILKNGKPAVQGTCPVCSTKVFRIGFRMVTMLPKIRNSLLLENVQGFLLASGWGTFELRGEIKGKVGSVSILDPPTFERDVSYGNQFLEGIASGLLEAISMSRNRMTLLGESYDRTNRILTMHFAEHLQDRAQLTIEERLPIPQVNSVPSRLSLIKSGRRISKQADKEEIIASNTTIQNKPEASEILAEVPKADEKVEPQSATEQQQEVENIIQSLNEIAEEARKAIPETIEPPDQEADEEKAELLVSVKEKNNKAASNA